MRKGPFDEYFRCSTSEKRSILIISILILIGIIGTSVIKHLPNKRNQFSEEERNQINKLALKLSKTNKPKDFSNAKKEKITRTLFPFDPNTASKEELKKLGFSEGQIRTIKNYLSSGGRFYKKEDFKKIYTLNDEEYLVYEPYIQIKSSPRKSTEEIETEFRESVEKPETELKVENKKIELNTAEIYNLTIIRGIGEIYANRILKYRGLLGGFCNGEQLKEVYGINDSIYSQIITQVEIDTSLIKTFDLNNVSYKELIRHPYLDGYYTKAILNYRDFKGKRIGKEDLLRDNILPKEIFVKVSPYINP